MSLIGLGVAGCTDTERFTSLMGPDQPARGDNAAAVAQGAPGPVANSPRVDSTPMPPIATAGGSAAVATAAPGGSEITGAVPSAAPASDGWTRVGGKPVVVARGETLDVLARKYAVPAHAIMQANAIASPGAIHAGQHLVIPRRSSAKMAVAAGPRDEPARTHLAAASDAPKQKPQAGVHNDTKVHVVAPGETLNSIARHYGKPVLVLARASNIPVDTRVKVGQHIVIPGVRRPKQEKRANAPASHKADHHEASHHEPAKQKTAKHEASHEAAPGAAVHGQSVHSEDTGREVAHRQVASADDSSGSAFKATTLPPPPAAAKQAEADGALPSFRWPVRGHVITGFGPKPNGLQNDGIDLAVPQGTPVKAADDGVVAYAGNELKGYGNLVLIRHSNGYVTAYAHASEILVKRGEAVKRGQVIAKSGDTGTVKSPELHFEIRKGATPVDPAQYLKGA